MPSSAEHKVKADHNRQFLTAAQEAYSPEWTAVVAFYTALHLVERWPPANPFITANTPIVWYYLKKHKQHRGIHAAFLALFDASLLARYGTANQFMKAFPANTVNQILVSQKLAAVETHVDSYFQPPARASSAGANPATGS